MDSSSSGERLARSLAGSSSASGTGHLIGRKVGQYQVTGLIAQGGMGAVYEARHLQLNRAVALKVMLPGMDASSEDVQRFLREAHAAARLTHPNLVPIYDVGDAHGVRYLAMELVRGDTLHNLVRRRGQLPEDLAVELVLGSARGLQHAHEQGVLHRDLKPANVIVQHDGTPRVTDFGVAKTIGNARLTATGTALGTPNYMSPEQAMGLNEELDARTDIYGLGAILYECLTGQPPFNESSHVATMNAVVNDKPVPPSRLREGLSEDVEAICLKCLGKNPEDRYASCHELIADLEARLRGRTIRARAPRVWQRFARRLQRNAVVSSLVVLCSALFLAFLIVLLIPAVHDRRVAQLERRTRAAAAARIAQARQRLSQAAQQGDVQALEALLGELQPAAFRTALHEELQPPDQPGMQRAFERGLDELPAELGPPAAEVAYALAERAQGSQRLAHLVDAELRDPAGASARAARLEVLRALRARNTVPAQALVEGELQALVSQDDRVGQQARLELAQLDAERWRWDEVRSLLAVIDPQALEPDDRRRLQGLRAAEQAFGRSVRLRDSRLVVPYEEGGAPRLLTLDRDGSTLRMLAAAQEPGGALQELQHFGVLRPVSHMVAEDLDGDGAVGGVLVGTPGKDGHGLELRQLQLAGKRGTRDLWSEPSGSLKSVAVGDVDGDGAQDVVLLVSGVDPPVRLASAGQNVRALRIPDANAYAFSTLALADLDGDGKDELLAGGDHLGPLELQLLSVGPQGLTPRDRLPLGRVTRIQPLQLEGQTQLLVVIDLTDEDVDRIRERPTDAPWWWRDGVYLVGLEQQQLHVLRRWTYGPDQVPGVSSVNEAEGICAWTFQHQGVTWLARLARVRGEGQVLEIAPLQEVSLAKPTTPALRLRLQGDTLGHGDPGCPHCDLNQDGVLETVVGRWLGPLTTPTTAPWEPPPAAAPPSRAALLARVVLELNALGELELAQRYQQDLTALAPDGYQTAAARLAQVDAQVERAQEGQAEASRAFTEERPAEGREGWERAREQFHQAGLDAWAVARDAGAPAGVRDQAWRKALYALERAEAWDEALQALGEARASPLAADLRELLDDRWAAVARRASLRPVDLWVEGAQLQASSLFLCQRQGDALRLRCEPDSEVAVRAPFDLGQVRLPLALETEVQLPGPAWASQLELGLFQPRQLVHWYDSCQLLLGFRLSLWDVGGGNLTVDCVAAGLRSRVQLPGLVHDLRLRLELFPVAGGTRMTLRIWSGEELVQALTTVVSDVQLPPSVLLGAASPRFERLDGFCVPPHTAPGAWVTIPKLALEAGQAAPVLTELPSTPEVDPMLAHGAVLSARSQEALSARYNRLVQRGSADERVEGLLGALAAGSKQQTLVTQAIQYDPLYALKLLESASDALVDGGDVKVLAALRAGLDQAAGSQSASVRLVAESLRGDHLQTGPPPEARGALKTLTPLLRRIQLRALAGQQPDRVRALMGSLGAQEWVRLPLVRRIPAPVPLEAAEWASLLGEAPAHCRECRLDLLYRLRACAQGAQGQGQVAEASLALGEVGLWERALLEQVRLSDDVQVQRAALLALADHEAQRAYAGPLMRLLGELSRRGASRDELARYEPVLGPARFARALGQ